jgi:hypothetical protein
MNAELFQNLYGASKNLLNGHNLNQHISPFKSTDRHNESDSTK